MRTKVVTRVLIGAILGGALGIIVGALNGCAATPIGTDPPKVGTPYECTTEAGTQVSTFYGGPDCKTTGVYLDNFIKDWKKATSWECNLGKFHLKFEQEKISCGLNGEGTCYGVYNTQTALARVWVLDHGPVQTPWIVKHELGHHCMEQQNRIKSTESNDHCVFCASGYLPCECMEAAACLAQLFPEQGISAAQYQHEFCGAPAPGAEE